MKIQIMLSACVFFGIVASYAQNSKSYSITGEITGIPNGTDFYLIRSNEFGEADTVTKVRSRNGKFVMKGILENQPELHFVKIDTSILKLTNRTWIRLLLDTSNISISANIKKWPEAKIAGSRMTDDFDSMNIRVGQIISEANIKIKEAGKDRSKISSIKESLFDEIASLLMTNPDSYATPLIATSMKALGLERSEGIYSMLSERIKHSLYGERLSMNIYSLKANSQIAENSIIPTFTFQLQDGNDVNIRQIVSKNRITLLDFWASWCKPCRGEIPNLLKVYNSFHDRGFNIIGISSDSKREAWIKALSEDNMPWMQGIETESCRIGSKIFGLQSIPAYALIDSNGRLIAFECGSGSTKTFGPNIRGDKLYDTVERILNELEQEIKRGQF